MHGGLTVAYVPSPSFSSCWKADGLFLLLILATSNAIASRSFWSRVGGIRWMPRITLNGRIALASDYCDRAVVVG